MKRHFTGKPVGVVENESSSDSESGSESFSDGERIHDEPKRVNLNISIENKKDTSQGDSRVSASGHNVNVVDVRKDLSSEEELNNKDHGSESHENGVNAGGDTIDDNERESDSDDDSEDSDDDDSNSDSDSDEPQILKPVFLSKKQRLTSKSTISKDDKSIKDKERTLKTIESHILQDIELRKQLEEPEDFNGIDDTDYLDVELEKAQWELRNLQRIQRDRKKLEQEQEEFEELENRRLRTEEERIQEYHENLNKDGESKSKSATKSAFFQEEALLKREISGENEKYDKSLLPQRFNPLNR